MLTNTTLPTSIDRPGRRPDHQRRWKARRVPDRFGRQRDDLRPDHQRRLGRVWRRHPRPGGDLTLVGCTVSGNSAQARGGGVALVPSSTAMSAPCSLTARSAGTSASGGGGGLLVSGGQRHAHLLHRQRQHGLLRRRRDLQRVFRRTSPTRSSRATQAGTSPALTSRTRASPVATTWSARADRAG